MARAAVELMVQAECGADQSQVAEGLREVAEPLRKEVLAQGQRAAPGAAADDDDAIVLSHAHTIGPPDAPRISPRGMICIWARTRAPRRCDSAVLACGHDTSCRGLYGATGQGRMNRSTALAKPSSSLVVVTRRAACRTSWLALPMAMLSPEWANMSTSSGMSPIVAICSDGMS